MLHLKLYTHGKRTFSMNTLFAQFTHIVCLNPALLPRIWLIQIRIICVFIFKLSSWHWPNNVIIFLLLACMFDKILLRVMYLVLPQIPKRVDTRLHISFIAKASLNQISNKSTWNEEPVIKQQRLMALVPSSGPFPLSSRVFIITT